MEHIYYNGRPIESRIWSIERRHVQWPWTTPTPSFKVTPFFDTEYLRNGTRCRQFQWNTNRDLHMPYYTVSFGMTLSDLAKYSMTQSVTRSLCDSWASCYGRPLSVSGRPCYILPMFFFIFFYGRLILRPWWMEVRESFTRGGPWVSLKKLVLGFFSGHP